MKKYILAAALTLSASAQAFDMETCTAISIFAEETMEARQAGVSLKTMLEVSEAVKSDGRISMVGKIIIMAHKKPMFSNQDLIDKEISQFGSIFMLACIERI